MEERTINLSTLGPGARILSGDVQRGRLPQSVRRSDGVGDHTQMVQQACDKLQAAIKDHQAPNIAQNS